jgi:hypothetical protein
MIARSRLHLKESGKEYGPHGVFALKAGFLLIYAGVTSLIHAAVPALFPFTSRDIVRDLADRSRSGQG